MKWLLLLTILSGTPAPKQSAAKVLNLAEDAHPKNMSTFEADEQLRGRHALMYVGAELRVRRRSLCFCSVLST